MLIYLIAKNTPSGTVYLQRINEDKTTTWAPNSQSAISADFALAVEIAKDVGGVPATFFTSKSYNTMMIGQEFKL